MTGLSRDAILGADDLPVEEIDIPEWGGKVYVRTLSGRERDRLEESIQTGRGKGRKVSLANLRARVASMVLSDAEGNRMFTDQDAEALGGKSASALDRIMEVGMKLNRYSDEDVNELVKN